LKQGKVTLAAGVAAGGFTPAQGNPAPYRNLPAFCRVAATLTPTADSEIKIEVWLPTAGWNRDLQSVGNGAWAGSISYAAMAGALAAGYATASTDTGHTGNAVEFAFGHPEKVNDFGYRAVHEMTVAAKAIVAAFYGNAPRHSYFNGCSTGGRQALTEAQRYPADYDGIIAGAPAIYASRLQGMQVWVNQTAHATEGSYIPPDKYKALHDEVMAVCDAVDGVKDSVIENPRRCKFDPSLLLCQAGDTADCLTPAQIEFAQKVYAGPQAGGTAAFPGLEIGTELGWGMLAAPKPMAFAEEIYRLALGDRSWTAGKFSWAETAKFEKSLGGVMDANNPDLRPFFNRGGKLLMYHGWADPGIPPGNTIRYFGEVAKAVGKKKADTGMRLFMVPGMGHCRGGGTDTFDTPGALSRWVEQREAPDRLVASRVQNGKADRTRPLCRYPQQAVYSGGGSTDEAANFSCRLP
jgi:feruloyl esterase